MRHGPAEDQASDGLDASRALTTPGRERVRHVAKRLADLGERPKLIVSSPLVRALQTAEIVYAVSPTDGAVEANTALAPRGPAHDFVRYCAKQGGKRLMVVGHEPDLSLLVGQLTGHSMPYGGFSKAMVVSLRVPNEGGFASIRFVLEPKTLEIVDDTRTPQ
jgi:phosphohistidine phosphatase